VPNTLKPASALKKVPKAQVQLRFLGSQLVQVLPVTAQTPDSCALVHSVLRRKGQPVPTNEMRIAARALKGGARLPTGDAPFAQIAAGHSRPIRQSRT
jgi:predicted nucleic acid-binding protein